MTRGDTGLCLAMIVRNEAQTLPRMVASLDGVIDQWLIVDTGSDDGTPEVVEALLGHLPGQLERRPWVNFGHNRTELVELCAGLKGVTHLLLADADMEFTVDEDFRQALADNPAHILMVRVDSGGLEFRQSYLVRTGPGWYYEGATHEYLACRDEVVTSNFDQLAITHHADGGSRTDKFERDEALLTAHLNTHPDDARSVFYLAQTYRDLGRFAEAIETYERRVSMGGWAEEVYYSLLRAGELQRDSGDLPLALWTWQRAVQARPQRPESYHRLGQVLNEQAQWEPARVWLERAAALAPCDDMLFVERWVEKWGIAFELAIARWWTGDRIRADATFADLLRRTDIPATVMEACERNLALP